MRKKLSKFCIILVVIAVIILGFQNFSFADVVVDRSKEIMFGQFGYIILGCSSIGLVFFSIVYINLKRKLKKQENEKNIEDMEKNKSTIQKWLYVCLIGFAIAGLILLNNYSEYDLIIISKNWFNIIKTCVSVLIAISCILRIISMLDFKKFLNKKMSLIACLLAIIISFTIYVGEKNLYKMKEEFNEKFRKYIGYEINWVIGDYYITDNEKLIETVKENNKGNRKVLIKYRGKDYVTSEELNNLSNIIGSNKISVTTNYGDDKFINEIKLGVLHYLKLGEYEAYKGEKVRGGNVKQLIKLIRHDGFLISVKFMSDNGQGEELNNENYNEILSKIQNNKTYKVEVSEDIIKITSN